MGCQLNCLDVYPENFVRFFLASYGKSLLCSARTFVFQDLEVTLTLLPETLPVSEGRSDLDETVNGDDLGSEDVEDVAEGLETRAQRLENLMTAKEFLGRNVAEQLQPFLSSRFVMFVRRRLYILAK